MKISYRLVLFLPVLLTLALSVSRVGDAAPREELQGRSLCTRFLDGSANFAISVISDFRLGYYQQRLLYQNAFNRSTDSTFDRVFARFEQGKFSREEVSTFLLENWFMPSSQTKERMIRWFSDYGTEREAVQILRLIRDEQITRGFLFESLIEIALNRGLPWGDGRLLDSIDFYWLRKFTQDAWDRGISRKLPEAQLAKREALFRSTDYLAHKDDLVRALERSLGGRASELSHYLNTMFFYHGEKGRVVTGFEGIYDPYVKSNFSNPVADLLYKLIEGRLKASLSRGSSYYAYVAVDAISITLNWLSQEPLRRWTPELQKNFLELVHAFSDRDLSFIASYRPELLPLLTVKNATELANAIKSPNAIQPKLIRFRDL